MCWHKEYNGYFMAGPNGNPGGSMYYCIDEHLEVVKGSGSCDAVHLLYTVVTHRSHVATTNTNLSCVVRTK